MWGAWIGSNSHGLGHLLTVQMSEISFEGSSMRLILTFLHAPKHLYCEKFGKRIYTLSPKPKAWNQRNSRTAQRLLRPWLRLWQRIRKKSRLATLGAGLGSKSGAYEGE